MPEVATTSVEATAVHLAIPCECRDRDDHGDGGCSAPADLWIIVHDLYDDCRGRDLGVVSVFVCQGCWDAFIGGIDRGIAAAARVGCALECESCGLHIHRRTDVVHRLVPIRGTSR